MRKQAINISRLFPLLTAVTVILGINFWQLQRKEGVYIDEVFTLMVCSGSFENANAARAADTTMTGRQLRAHLLDMSSVSERLVQLRENTHDIMWTNVYYSLALIVAGHQTISERGQLQDALNRLHLLNLFLLFCCLLISYRTLRLCDLTPPFAALLLIPLYGSCAVTATVLLARGFVLALLAAAFYTYVFVRQYQILKNGRRYTPYIFFEAVAAVALCLLTAYSLLPFIILLQLYLFIDQLFQSREKAFVLLIQVVPALSLTLLVYPRFFVGCCADGYAGSPHEFLHHFMPEPLLTQLAYLLYHLHRNVALLLPPTLVVFLLMSHRIEWRNSVPLRPFAIVGTASWIAIIIIWIIAPYRTLRYIVPMLPGAMMILPAIIRRMHARYWRWAWLIVVILTLVPHVISGSIELQHNDIVLRGVKNIHVDCNDELTQLQASLLPFIDDDAVLHFKPSDNENTVTVTTNNQSTEGKVVHRFLVIK